MIITMISPKPENNLLKLYLLNYTSPQEHLILYRLIRQLIMRFM